MQLESLETAISDAAMRPPAAAMQPSPEPLTLGDAGNDAATTQQDPEFPENVGEDTGMHLPPELQRVVYQFARPVFRRCGRHLRAEKSFSNGEYEGFRITKIGADEGRSYPAIVNQPMAPNTGVYRWTWVVRRSWSGIVMPGVCTEAADPDQHSLRFRPHGAAYECWTGLIYGFDQNTNSGHPPTTTGCKHRMGDEIAFKLDTNQGLLEIYHSYYGRIHTMHVPGVTLYMTRRGTCLNLLLYRRRGLPRGRLRPPGPAHAATGDRTRRPGSGTRPCDHSRPRLRAPRAPSPLLWRPEAALGQGRVGTPP